MNPRTPTSQGLQKTPTRDKSPTKPTLKPQSTIKEPEVSPDKSKSNNEEEDSKEDTEKSSFDEDERSNVEQELNGQKDSKLLQTQPVIKVATEPRTFNSTICNDHHNLLQNIIDRSHQVDWDIPLKPRKKFIGHIGKPEHFCWGNGIHLTELISCDDMGQVIHWSGHRGKKITVFNLGVPLIWVDMESQTGKFSIAGSTNGTLFLLELNTERKGKIIKGSGRSFGIDAHKGAVTACRFLSSNIIVSGSTDKSVSIWDLDERSSQISKHTCHDGAITSIDVSGDDPNILLTSSLDKTCKIWDIRVKNPVQHEYKKHLGAVNDVEFLPGMISSFASGGDDGSVRLYDLRVTKELAIFIDKMNHHALNSISFSPSGRVIVAATEDRKVKAWDTLYDGDPFQYFDYGFQVPIQWTKLSKDGFTMAILGKDGVIGIAY